MSDEEYEQDPLPGMAKIELMGGLYSIDEIRDRLDIPPWLSSDSRLWQEGTVHSALKVLNGYVQIGDKIAYATRSGSYMTMNIGTVTEVRDKAGKIKVRVDQSSDGFYTKIVTLEILGRVVKL
jgi:hypothetical protein